MKNSIPTSKKTQCMLFRETVAVYSENHTKPVSTLCRKNAELLTVKADANVF